MNACPAFAPAAPDLLRDAASEPKQALHDPADGDEERCRDRVEQAIAHIAAGRPVVVVDDEDRENEGDLVIAAEKATGEIVAFMMSECRRLICAPMEGEELD
ncbi:3,4-dihydroxy-2-butanone-4-phosphate synthase, partial [Streptomyces sp. NPDC058605]|uniref:3,4-dihydroxy-2-butanone-4-phosphate synthase n=1 Tax=Streptomyces sp. NPDC058605 TaxID=3346552 RepID=UPI003651B5AB